MERQNRKRHFTFLFLIFPAAILLSSYTSPHRHYFAGNNNYSALPPVGKDTPRDAKNGHSSLLIPSFSESKMDVFDSLDLGDLGLSRKVFDLGLKGMQKLRKKGMIHSNILSIVDLSQSSTEKRLYVIDLDNYELLYNTWVAHGRNSGASRARYFSNRPRSRKTSLGFYITGDTYQGSNGYSLKLEGMESGFNSNAYRRGIVVHGAKYVSENFIESQGYIGRSYGCPAVPSDISSGLIDQIKNGTCLFVFAPSSNYLQHSRLLH